MTTSSIMTSQLYTLKPEDTVADAIALMRERHVRSLPVVDDSGCFVGLFGLRRLTHLLLPKAASSLGDYSVSELHFLPDDAGQMGDRWTDIAGRPVVNYLEKKKKLMFCTPDTSFPELLSMLNHSDDSSLPVMIVKGDKKKVVGMVSPWDVLEGLISGRLTNQPLANGTESKHD